MKLIFLLIDFFKDLVGTDDFLQQKLILELVQYQKDIETADKFLNEFGYEKILNKLPESQRDFFIKNIEIIKQNNKKNFTKLYEINNRENFYYPESILNETNIRFIDDESKFNEMLDYFETKRPTTIGLDCEWK